LPEDTEEITADTTAAMGRFFLHHLLITSGAQESNECPLLLPALSQEKYFVTEATVIPCSLPNAEARLAELIN
jgi:hypothetical protein